MDEKEKKPLPTVAKVVKPERKLTKEEQLEIKQAEFEKKQRAERERVQELRRKMKEKEEEKKTSQSVETVETVELPEDVFSKDKTVLEAEIVPYKAKSRREYQRNLCRKYGIKRKELQLAIEEAKKMFVARLTVNFNSKIVVAIVDLLEFGDI